MPDKVKSPIARIDELSALARSAWFSLLGFLAFVSITLLSMTDADFLVGSRKTELPMIGIEIPTTLLFYLAPILATVLYVNLHLYLAKLWEAFAEAPKDEENMLLSDQIQPWLVNDYALYLKSGTTPRDNERTRTRNLVTIFSVWLAEPLLLLWLWVESLAVRDMLMTLAIFLAILVSAGTGIDSWLQAPHKLKQRDLARLARPLHWGFALACAIGATASVGLSGGIREMSGLGPKLAAIAINGDLGLRAMFAPAMTIDRENLVGLPEAWKNAQSSRDAFRTNWCEVEGVELNVCGNMPAANVSETNLLILQRRGYCAAQENVKRKIRGPGNCARFFDRLDRKFDTAWRMERNNQIEQIPELDLSQRDMGGASAEDAKLVRAKLYQSNLSDANLTWATLEGATLERGSLAGSTAFYARFDRANLTRADLRDANLSSTEFEGATLRGARLNRARLRDATLVAADLRGADLRGANLREARLHRARLAGAILSDADLRGALGLTQVQLANVVGNATTKLPIPRTINADYSISTPELDVWTCWRELPDEIEQLLANQDLSDADRAEIRDYVCAPGQDPQPTGKQLPLEPDAPQEEQLATGDAEPSPPKPGIGKLDEQLVNTAP